MLRSVGGRLFLSYLGVVAVGLLVAAITISGLFIRYENDVLRLRLQELSAPLLTAMQTGLRNGQQPREVIDTLAEQAGSADARLLVLANNRRVLVDSESTLTGQTLATPTQANFGGFADRDAQWLFVQQAFRPAAVGVNPAIIVVARPRAAFGDALRALLPSLLVAGVVAAGFALIVAGLLSRTITRPLRELVAGARRFARGEYRTRVPVAGPDEVAELGGAFNEMAGEIERARDSEQAFLADISHELRTPLTSIQGFAQAIAEGEAAGEAAPPAAKIIQRESRRLIRMVEGLLEVAKLQAGGPELARERVEATTLVASAVAALEVQAHEAGVRLEVATDGLPAVRGDPDRLAQLFTNLIDNAVKHSPRGASVAVRGSREDGQAVVRVRDAGSGLPGGAQTRQFRRFYRGDNAQQSGAGLGLAIAQAIAVGEAAGEAAPPAAKIIQRESRRLIRMVEGLLEVAKLQAGGPELARERVEAAALVTSAVAALEVQAQEAGVRLEVATDGLPAVRGDPDRLAQLFTNLIDNAVKHSPRGASVAVRGSREDGQAVVRVRDAGSGVPGGAQTRLFRRFYRGDNAQQSGAGLGLAIAQAIAVAHGGAITARNVDEGGAEFTVRLPAV